MMTRMLPLSHRRRPLIANPLRAVALLTALLIGHSGALAKSTKIDIDTVPPGATVYLADSEGGETSLGQTPLTGMRVP